MLVHRCTHLPPCVVIARSKRNRGTLVILGGGVSRAKVRDVGRFLLTAGEQQELNRELARQA